MTNLVNSLETCWYLSPPWESEIPPLFVSLLERVYVTTVQSFGYCCGVEWLQGEWNYAIALNDEVVFAAAPQLVGTRRFQLDITDKPVFALGEKVVFRRSLGSGLRIIQGIHRVQDFWTYTVEWISPDLAECNGKILVSSDLRAWVTDTDLVKMS